MHYTTTKVLSMQCLINSSWHILIEHFQAKLFYKHVYNKTPQFPHSFAHKHHVYKMSD